MTPSDRIERARQYADNSINHESEYFSKIYAYIAGAKYERNQTIDEVMQIIYDHTTQLKSAEFVKKIEQLKIKHDTDHNFKRL